MMLAMLNINTSYSYICCGCGKETEYDVWECRNCGSEEILQIYETNEGEYKITGII